MGEYARRKSDGAEIKIGTCESMYYLRLEDKDKVSPMEGSGFGHYWRLPFPDEDNILPGDYEDYNRKERIYRENDNFTDPSTANEPGTMQMHNESGLLVNVKCYHGEKLPEDSKDVKFHWNGKSWFLELYCLRTDGDKVFPIVACRFCGKMWRYEWSDVEEYNPLELRERLRKYFHHKNA